MRKTLRHLTLLSVCLALCIARDAPAGADYGSGISRVDAGDGTSTADVTVSWTGERRFDRYHVYRSFAEGGPFDEIGQSESEYYTDTTALPGVKYWYAVRGYMYWTLGEQSQPDDGYRKIPQPCGFDFNRIVDEKSESPEKGDRAEYRKFESVEPVMKPYYIQSLKLSLAIYIARSYISRGTITVLRGFDSYLLDPDARSISLNLSAVPCVIDFKSRKLFRIYAAGGQDLLDRLLANAVFYCIYEGDKEIDGGNGITYMLPRFEAIGLSTGFFNNDREWKDRTILLGTDDKEYREKIKSAGG